jgi:dihydrofolate reductase
MGKVIIHATMSLDGFIAGPHDEMDWVFKYDDDGMANEVMEETGAVVLGRRTFEISLKNNQLPYGGM